MAVHAVLFEERAPALRIAVADDGGDRRTTRRDRRDVGDDCIDRVLRKLHAAMTHLYPRHCRRHASRADPKIDVGRTDAAERRSTRSATKICAVATRAMLLVGNAALRRCGTDHERGCNQKRDHDATGSGVRRSRAAQSATIHRNAMKSGPPPATHITAPAFI